MQVEGELASLPERPSGHLPLLIHTRIVDFERKLQQHFDGGSQNFPFRTTWHSMALAFRKELADNTPVIVYRPTRRPNFAQPTTEDSFGDLPRRSIPGVMRDASDSIIIDSDGDSPCAGTSRRQPRSDKKRALDHPPTLTPSKKSKLDRIPPYNGGSGASFSPSALHASTSVGEKARFTFEDIREIITAAYVGLPFQTDSKAIEQMNQISMKPWERSMTCFLEQTEILCQQIVVDRIREEFGLWTRTPLYDRITNICKAFLLKAMAEQRAAAQRNYCMEKQETMTFNDEALAQAQAEALKTLQVARRDDRRRAYVAKLEMQSGKAFSDQAFNDRVLKVTDEQLGVDPFNQELKAMAVSRIN